MKRKYGFRKARSSGRSFRFARKSGHKSGGGLKLIHLDAMIYGAVRAPISQKLTELLPIPVIGTVGDEVAMGLLDYIVAKNTSGMIRDVALKGLVIENARLGEAVVGMTGLLGTSNTTTPYLYG